mgnify:CR=1 FL=1
MNLDSGGQAVIYLLLLILPISALIALGLIACFSQRMQCQSSMILKSMSLSN